MARLDIRVAGRLRFSKNVEPDSLELEESGGALSVAAKVKKVGGVPSGARPLDKPAPEVFVERPKPTEPEPEAAVTEPEPEVTEPEVTEPEPETEVTEPAEIVGGVANLETGEITDPDSGELIGTVDLESGEVTDAAGETVGTVDLDDTDSGVLDIVDEDGEVVGAVEVSEE